MQRYTSFLRVETRRCRKVVVVKIDRIGNDDVFGFTFIGVFTIGVGCPAFSVCFALHGTQREALQTLGTPSICEGQTFPAQQTPYIHFPHGLQPLTCESVSVAFSTLAAVFQAFPQVWPYKLDSMMMIVAKRNIYNPRRVIVTSLRWKCSSSITFKNRTVPKALCTLSE
jgi:hypothetical protein